MIVKTLAFFNDRYPYGGGEVVTHHLAKFFVDQGIKVILYTTQINHELLTEEDHQLFTFQPLPIKSKPNDPQNTDFLCTSLRDNCVDILISQGITNLPFEKIKKLTSCKTLFCLHNKTMWEVDMARKTTLSEKNLTTFWKKAEYLLLRYPLNKITSRIERRTINMYARMLLHLDRMILLCPNYRDEMSQLLSCTDFPDHKFVSIYNPMLPIDSEIRMPKEKLVLYVGRLVKTHKRVDRLLRIWQKIERHNPEWKLILLGQGEEEQKLKELAIDLKLKQVKFAGYQKEVSKYYRRARFCCLTSNIEGLPMCLMEAQQYGVIPISFDSYAGIHDIAENGKSGIIVPAFNQRKYVQQLSETIRDDTRQEQLRTASMQAAHRYDLNTIGHQWLALFETL